MVIFFMYTQNKFYVCKRPLISKRLLIFFKKSWSNIDPKFDFKNK